MYPTRFLVLLALLLAGCEREAVLDRQLRTLIEQQQLDGNFQPDLSVQSPALAELGGQLFFSPDLSIDGSVSCASCHHPAKGGADGIALPIGIGGEDSRHVGEQRIQAARQANPDVDVNALIPRNSPSVINAALYRQAMFWDGRIHYRPLPDQPGERYIQAGVFGAGQANPSNYRHLNLLQTQARMPISSVFEMKGGLKPNLNNHEIEQDVLHFLQASGHWCQAFAAVFGDKSCDTLITLDNLTAALAEFEASLVLTNSPFERYIRGDLAALDKQQKRGAIHFLQDRENGGAGCVACHSGKTFSNEQFYNINIPPSGRGANEGGWDLGRNNVDKAAERFSFRVPILLNVAHTAPYFHNGVAATLEHAIRHKQTAADAVRPASVIAVDEIDYAPVRQAIADSFAAGPAKALLPEHLSDRQVADLAAFLRSLGDDCLADSSCVATLTRPVVASARQQPASRPEPQRQRLRQAVKAPQLACAPAGRAGKTGRPGFTRHDGGFGLDHRREIGLIKKGWLIDVINYASVSAQDLTGNCLDDLLFDAGQGRLLWYAQQPDGHFVAQTIGWQPPAGAVNALVMDVDGDYRPDLFVGNYGASPAALVFDFLQRDDDVISLQTLTGPVINATAGDINGNGSMDMVFALWRSFNSLKQPHVWFNDGNGNLSPDNGFITLRQHQRNMGGGEDVKRITPQSAGAADLTFTPNLADIDMDGDADLLLAADFSRSQVLENRAGRLLDITDKSVINDSNGMGAAVADFNGDGLPDWFVTSIVDSRIPAIDGHKLYINEGNGRFRQQPVINKTAEWSWGACAADFNNDGHLDIFYISGFAEAMASASYQSEEQQQATDRFLDNLRHFAGSRPTLLINDGEGNFTDQSAAYGLADTLDGRGVACFDHRQDGDIDIVVTPLEGAPVLFSNQLDGSRNWLAIRLLGEPGNTEAMGARLSLQAGGQRQYRQVMLANNFVSRNPAQLHFGLGNADAVEQLVITLPPPHNKTVILENLATNRLHVLSVAELLERAD